jgi:hypothetical protein
MRQISKTQLLRDNLRSMEKLYENISDQQISSLRDLTTTLRLSVRRGELLLLDRQWYVTHSGLLRIARRKRCRSITTELIENVSSPREGRWIFKATVTTSSGASFGGWGNADANNVSPRLRGSEMRIAETRAANRALRKAFGIGLCSVEEIGSSVPPSVEKFPPQNSNGNGNGSAPKVRDRLCQIIRQHKLDPELVKSYAVDFCGTKTLREATRDQVENFVQRLAEWAEKDRNALICQLNSYARPKQEVVA